MGISHYYILIDRTVIDPFLALSSARVRPPVRVEQGFTVGVCSGLPHRVCIRTSAGRSESSRANLGIPNASLDNAALFSAILLPTGNGDACRSYRAALPIY